MKRFLLFCFLNLLCPAGFAAENTLNEVVVYKSPACGCCTNWISHLRENGFRVTAVDVEDVNVYKRQYGVPARLGSCHTAVIDGYVIEGHVPAIDIQRLLTIRPDVTGLTVPGMPLGSPGMEMGDQVHAYDVLTMEKDGSVSTFSSYPEQ